MGLIDLARILDRGQAWRQGHARLLLHQVYDRDTNRRAGYSDRDHLSAAGHWLRAAQDAMDDGGICGRYHLHKGWTSSYPETTGYIVPTFLALAEELGDEDYVSRAERAIRFLLDLQLDSGAFPGGEVAENTSQPSPFNTAQIVNGLVAWHAATGCSKTLDAAMRAGNWLTDVQDADGAWRQYYYEGHATTYSAHLSCWLAELGQHVGEQKFVDSASRHLNWVLEHRDPATGWIDLCGFTAEQHEQRFAVTHTIAYTLDGILRISEITGNDEGIDAVRQAAEGILRRLELSRRLPGFLDHGWKQAHAPACLTGNAQMALIWFRLFELFGDGRYVNAALKAIDLIKEAQPMDNPNAGIYGGVPGSDPIWGDYIKMAVPNWAAKFYCDALMRKKAILGSIGTGTWPQFQAPRQEPLRLPEVSNDASKSDFRFVLYASPRTHKVQQFLQAWSSFGFKPAAVIVSEASLPDTATRMKKRLRQRGMNSPLKTTGPAKSATDPKASISEFTLDPTAYCEAAGIPVIRVGSLDSQEAVRAVEALRPDIAVHAGAGILREAILSVPRLGTLNVHMGLLPYYRGMNVVEWALFNGDLAGCSVHLIDPGIDTGRILATRTVEMDGTRSVADARARVDAAQVELLGDVVHYVQQAGSLPPGRDQAAPDGVQFFTMHDALKDLVDQKLAG